MRRHLRAPRPRKSLERRKRTCRNFFVENLEELDLFSVTAFSGASEQFEPANMAQQTADDVIDKTGMSLISVFKTLENIMETSLQE